MKATTDGRRKITSLSRVLKMLMVIPIVVVPLVLCGVWFFMDRIPSGYIAKSFNVTEISFGSFTKLLGFSVSLVQSTVAVVLFLHIYRLFALYEKGKILVAENVRCFKGIGMWLLLQAVASFVAQPLYVAILTVNNGPGKGMLSIGMNSSLASTFFSGCFILIVGWVMEEARRANEELELVI